MFDKQNLIRVVKFAPNKFCVGTNKKIQGRSAYICKSKKCFERSKKIKAFEHSFKSHFASEIYKELTDEFEKIL